MEPRFETVQADAASSFRCVWFTCSSFAENHTWHYHPEYELIWIVSTCGTRFVGDNIEPYQAGDLVFVGPNLPHCWHDGPHGGGDKPEAVVVQFRPETIEQGFFSLPEFQAIRRLFRAALCGLHIEGATAAHLQNRMRCLFAQKGLARLFCLLDILHAMSEAESDLRYLASTDYHLTNGSTELNRRRIELIHRYVRKNLSEQISQVYVADLVGLTPAAFSRFFRQATGQTFVGFVNILRVNEVCRAMTESNRSIANIAMGCGYNN